MGCCALWERLGIVLDLLERKWQKESCVSKPSHNIRANCTGDKQEQSFQRKSTGKQQSVPLQILFTVCPGAVGGEGNKGKGGGGGEENRRERRSRERRKRGKTGQQWHCHQVLETGVAGKFTKTSPRRLSHHHVIPQTHTARLCHSAEPSQT